MKPHELYAELGRQLGIAEVNEFLEAERPRAISALAAVLAAVAAAKDLGDFHVAGIALSDEGERLRKIGAKHFEDAVLAESTERDRQRVRNAGVEGCPLCGTLGEHVCRAVKPEAVDETAAVQPDKALFSVTQEPGLISEETSV